MPKAWYTLAQWRQPWGMEYTMKIECQGHGIKPYTVPLVLRRSIFSDQKISFLTRVLEITLVIHKSVDNLMAGGGIVRNF